MNKKVNSEEILWRVWFIGMAQLERNQVNKFLQLQEKDAMILKPQRTR